jgi:hypothetical protein
MNTRNMYVSGGGDESYNNGSPMDQIPSLRPHTIASLPLVSRPLRAVQFDKDR